MAQHNPLEKWRLRFSGGFQPQTGAQPPTTLLRSGRLAPTPLPTIIIDLRNDLSQISQIINKYL